MVSSSYWNRRGRKGDDGVSIRLYLPEEASMDCDLRPAQCFVQSFGFKRIPLSLSSTNFRLNIKIVISASAKNETDVKLMISRVTAWPGVMQGCGATITCLKIIQKSIMNLKKLWMRCSGVVVFFINWIYFGSSLGRLSLKRQCSIARNDSVIWGQAMASSVISCQMKRNSISWDASLVWLWDYLHQKIRRNEEAYFWYHWWWIRQWNHYCVESCSSSCITMLPRSRPYDFPWFCR